MAIVRLREAATRRLHTRLIEAARNADVGAMREALVAGAPPDGSPDSAASPLQHCIDNGCIEGVRLLRAHGATPGAKRYQRANGTQACARWVPLVEAARRPGLRHALRELLGFEGLEQRDLDHAIVEAARHGRSASIEPLFNAGADIDACAGSVTAQTALHQACAAAHHGACAELARLGADPTRRTTDGLLALDLAAQNASLSCLCTLVSVHDHSPAELGCAIARMLANEALLPPLTPNPDEVMAWALAWDHVDPVRHAPPPLEALEHDLERRMIGTIDMLATHGADLAAPGADLLSLAVLTRPAVVRYLIASGAPCDAPDAHGERPLLIAARAAAARAHPRGPLFGRGSANLSLVHLDHIMAELLVSGTADPDAVDARGATAREVLRDIRPSLPYTSAALDEIDRTHARASEQRTAAPLSDRSCHDNVVSLHPVGTASP